MGLIWLRSMYCAVTVSYMYRTGTGWYTFLSCYWIIIFQSKYGVKLDGLCKIVDGGAIRKGRKKNPGLQIENATNRVKLKEGVDMVYGCFQSVGSWCDDIRVFW